MGQNYENNTYKKTYDGEYVKSYEDKVLVKKELEKRVKSYKEITQNAGSYNKKEKGVFDAGNTERTIDVFDKPVRKAPRKTITIQEQKPIRQQSTIKPVQKEVAGKDTQQKEVSKTVDYQTPPPPPKTKIEIKQTPKPISKSIVSEPEVRVRLEAQTKPSGENKKTYSRMRDYDAYRALVMVPVREEASGIYREMINQEIVDEKEARKILDYAGYKEKASIDFMKFGLIAFLATIILKLVGAIVVLAWAYFFKQRNYIVLEKKMGFSNLSIRMPANESEKNKITTTGTVYIVISAIMFIVAIIRTYAS